MADAFISWKADLVGSLGTDNFGLLETTLADAPSSQVVLLAVHELMAADLVVLSRTDLSAAAAQIPGFTTFTNRTLHLHKKDLSPRVLACLDKVVKDRAHVVCGAWLGLCGCTVERGRFCIFAA